VRYLRCIVCLMLLIAVTTAAEARAARRRASSGVTPGSVAFSTRDIHNGGRLVISVNLTSDEVRGAPISCSALLRSSSESPQLPYSIPVDRCRARRLDATHYQLTIINVFPKVVVDRTYDLERVELGIKTHRGVEKIWASLLGTKTVKVTTAGQIPAEVPGWALQMVTNTGKYVVKTGEIFEVRMLVNDNTPILGGAIEARLGRNECIDTEEHTDPCSYSTWSISTGFQGRLGLKSAPVFYDDSFLQIAGIKTIPVSSGSQLLVVSFLFQPNEHLMPFLPLAFRFKSMTFFNSNLQAITVDKVWFVGGRESAVALPSYGIAGGEGLRILRIEH
jgi:hypothetical protein